MSLLIHTSALTAVNTRISSNFNCLKPTSKVQFSGNGFMRSMIEMVKSLAYRSNRDGGVDVQDDEGLNLVTGYANTKSLSTGFESTLNRLSKWIVSGSFAGLILWRHDTEVLWVVIGSVVNAMLSIVLKRVLNQERPVANLRSDPGMPSSHAQSIFYIFSFMILSIVEWMGIDEISLLLSGLVLSTGIYLTWLRVSQQLHTVPQVVVGAAIGSSFFSLWIFAWKAFVMEAFESNFPVQVVTYSVAAGLCFGFAVYVFRNWLKSER